MLWASILAAAAVFTPASRDGAAIQKAIDAANAAGGGVVRLERGVYESGTLYLKSGVELNVPEGAVLRGGTRPEDYDDVVDARIRKHPERSDKVFIACTFQTNVTVTGKGVIDGRGPCFYDTDVPASEPFYRKPPHPRPRMLQFVGCRDVRFEDITLKDSPGWTCWVRMGENVTAERVKILADQRMINNDGFHIDGCRHVRIRNCTFRTGDDCVVMRAIRSPDGESGLCEDMLVEDCDMSTSCSGVRLGCPSDGTIRKGVFRRLRIRGNGGILSGHPTGYLQEGSVGGFRMEDILFEDCDVESKWEGIAYYVEPGITLGAFGNTVFRNLRVKSGQRLMLRGNGNTWLENLRFENVKLECGWQDPMDMKAFRNVEFANCSFSSGSGEKEPPAVNECKGGWEILP